MKNTDLSYSDLVRNILNTSALDYLTLPSFFSVVKLQKNVTTRINCMSLSNKKVWIRARKNIIQQQNLLHCYSKNTYGMQWLWMRYVEPKSGTNNGFFAIFVQKSL